MPKLLTEFVGSFLFMFAIALAVAVGAPLAPLAIGCALMIMVYMGGHISGGHYNPAVSLAAFLRGAMPAKDVAPYMIAQVLGGVAAFCLGAYVTGRSFPLVPNPELGVVPALIVELLFTTALALVVLNVATNPKTAGNSFYGLAIGFTIVVAAIAGGPISGGCFNPAVGIGITLAHAIKGDGGFGALWIYLAAPLTGGALAAVIYKLQNPAEPAAT